MERPTQGDVEWLLQQTSVSGHGLAQLQAEVRALREVVDGLNGALEVFTNTEVEADKLRAAADMILKVWAAMTSQETYGEFLREGMCNVDFDAWEEAHDALRAALPGEP